MNVNLKKPKRQKKNKIGHSFIQTSKVLAGTKAKHCSLTFIYFPVRYIIDSKSKDKC